MIENLCGLVICGGNSSRMKTDKSLLQYHGKPQWQHLRELLQSFCKDVHISCNKGQVETIPPKYNVIVDSEQYKDMGPLTGVLSASAALPHASLLIIGCDYPLIGHNDLELLFSHSETGRSVAFRNEDGYVEPLVSVFQNRDLQKLPANYQKFNCSLRRFMEANNFLILDHPQPSKLKSIDTPEEYQMVIEQLANNKNAIS